jgi:exosortase J
MNSQITAGISESADAATLAAAPPGTRFKAFLAVVLVLLGLGGLTQQLSELWALWMGDPLRSFGMLLPLAAVCIGVRRFKAADWREPGSWWGFAAMLTAVLVAAFSANRNFSIAFLFGAHVLPLHVIPVGCLLYLYFAGAVLLFGGRKAFRTHRFPLALLLFVNPVPQMFTMVADLPLQAIGAHTARSFAQWLSVPVNGDTLKLMFSPQLGMFVAPGCDGLRGAVALGYLALIVGHLKRMRYPGWALFVGGAVLLAYLFNLLRLCGVILYYWVALRIPAISGLGTEADYVIGGILFFGAALFLFGMPRLLAARA